MKTLLLHIDSDPKNKQRITAAFDLADRFGSHIIACHPMPILQPYVPASIMTAADGDVIAQLMDVAEDVSAARRKEFEDMVPETGIEWEWVDGSGLAVESLIEYAPLVDLTIMSKSSDKESSRQLELIGDLAISSGLPILAIPESGAVPKDGKPVLIGWNGSLEAARALRAAMPFLKEASKVIVVEVGEGNEELPAADLGPYLARHGLNVETRRQNKSGAVAETLLADALAAEAELIVIGAYGHSRFREWALGGVTRDLLQGGEIPVFLCH